MGETGRAGPSKKAGAADGNDTRQDGAHNALPVTLDALDSTPPGTEVPAGPDAGEPRRVLLGDPGVQDRIRRELRKHGVSSEEVDDVLNDVVYRALVDRNLPLSDRKEAIRYLCALASNLPVARGRATEPQKLAGMVTRFLRDEVDKALGRLRGVSSGRLRAAVAGVFEHVRAFARTPNPVALVIAFFAVGGALLWGMHGEPTTGRPALLQGAPRAAMELPPPAPAPVTTPKERAAALRAEAQRAFEAGQWAKCIDLMDEAQGLDPEGETPELRELYAKAAERYTKAAVAK